MTSLVSDRPGVCAHSQGDLLWGGMLYRCGDCGLVCTAEQPRFEYAEDYFVDGGKGCDFDSPFSRAFDAERFEIECDELEAQGLRGSILDVGCATGTFLVHAKARGWEVSGVELVEFAREEARRRLGVEVVGSLGALPPGQRYDVVTLHHVLEHIEEPIPFLAQEVAPRVQNRLLIEVPNFASLGAQSDGPRWKDLRPEQHFYHFEPATLRAVVEASGFDVVRLYTLSESLWSLRAALRTLLTLRALAGVREFSSDPRGPVESDAVPDWTPRRGFQAAVTNSSSWVFRPLVRWIERIRRAERLVVEARPVSPRS